MAVRASRDHSGATISLQMLSVGRRGTKQGPAGTRRHTLEGGYVSNPASVHTVPGRCLVVGLSV